MFVRLARTDRRLLDPQELCPEAPLVLAHVRLRVSEEPGAVVRVEQVVLARIADVGFGDAADRGDLLHVLLLQPLQLGAQGRVDLVEVALRALHGGLGNLRVVDRRDRRRNTGRGALARWNEIAAQLQRVEAGEDVFEEALRVDDLALELVAVVVLERLFGLYGRQQRAEEIGALGGLLEQPCCLSAAIALLDLIGRFAADSVRLFVLEEVLLLRPRVRRQRVAIHRLGEAVVFVLDQLSRERVHCGSLIRVVRCGNARILDPEREVRIRVRKLTPRSQRPGSRPDLGNRTIQPVEELVLARLEQLDRVRNDTRAERRKAGPQPFE